MDAAGVAAVGILALAVVLAAALIAHRRGGLHLDVRIWWGNGRGHDPEPDQ